MKLSKDPRKEVFLTQKGTEKASMNVLSLIENAGFTLIEDDYFHPLERAGLSVQEDLCLIQRTSSGWTLRGASLSFPSLWKLREKVGKNMSQVHGPVDDYAQLLDSKVENFFDRIGEVPVWRRNWFIHADNSLHQPVRSKRKNPIIPSDKVDTRLHVRSERQTLRRLNIQDWILFTIRVQQSQLGRMIDQRKEEFTKWIDNAPISHHRHKAIEQEQLHEIKKFLHRVDLPR